MKRSEMEAIVAAAIDANGRFNDQVPTEELATIILGEVEQAGMLPPSYKKLVQGNTEIKFDAYEWEPESEGEGDVVS